MVHMKMVCQQGLINVINVISESTVDVQPREYCRLMCNVLGQYMMKAAKKIVDPSDLRNSETNTWWIGQFSLTHTKRN